MMKQMIGLVLVACVLVASSSALPKPESQEKSEASEDDTSIQNVQSNIESAEYVVMSDDTNDVLSNSISNDQDSSPIEFELIIDSEER